MVRKVRGIVVAKRQTYRLLLVLTVANCALAMVGLAMRPDTSNWGPDKLNAHALWTAAGRASFALLAGWILLAAIQRFRLNRSMVICGALIATHLVLWVMWPSWS